MNTLIPMWIIGGSFIGMLILSFSFKGSSAMGGSGTRYPPRTQDNVHNPADPSAPLLDPMHPNAPRRHV